MHFTIFLFFLFYWYSVGLLPLISWQRDSKCRQDLLHLARTSFCLCCCGERWVIYFLSDKLELSIWGQMPFQWPWSRCQELVCPSCDQSPLWKGKLDPEISAGCHGTRNEEMESPFYYMINDENRIIIMCFRLVFQSSQAYILMMSNSLCVVDR